MPEAAFRLLETLPHRTHYRKDEPRKRGVRLTVPERARVGKAVRELRAKKMTLLGIARKLGVSLRTVQYHLEDRG